MLLSDAELQIITLAMKDKFDHYKQDLLSKLNSGVDFSPKGSIDFPVVELVNFLNTLPGYMTTSSCSGRLSVYLNEHHTKGIRWILVKHRTVQVHEVTGAISNVEDASSDLVVLKCEAFILHVACRDIEAAKSLFQIAMGCGFRESGISIGQKHIIVAVRSTAFNLELPIARGNKLLVDNDYMNLIVDEANTRLRNNFSRTDRFFLELKKMYQFPTLKVNRVLTKEQSKVTRWGHTSITLSIDGSDSSAQSLPESVVFGGYGSTTAADTKNGAGEKCIRGLVNVVTRTIPTTKSKKGGPSSTVKTDKESVNNSMHAAGVNMTLSFNSVNTDVILLSGGRTSPQAPLPCIQSITLASDLTHSLRHSEVGEHIPTARWGHTLSVISADSCLMFGGRDDKQLCPDVAYIVTLNLVGAEEVQCRWVRLNLTGLPLQLSFAHPTNGAAAAAASASDVSSLPAPRCFHAAASINDVYVEYGQHRCYVLVHGGLLSLDNPTASGEVFMIDPWSQRVQVVENNAPDKGNKAGCCDASSIAATAEEKSEAVRVTGKRHGDAKDCIIQVKRFAHTLNKVGGKSLLLLGGVSSDLTGEEQSTTENPTVCLDLCLDGSGRYCVQYRNVPVVCDSQAEAATTTTDAAGTALPCQECRSHHTTSYQPLSRRLRIEGGGLHGLAFGPHLCCSLDTTISLGVELFTTTAGDAEKKKEKGPKKESRDGSVSTKGKKVNSAEKKAKSKLAEPRTVDTTRESSEPTVTVNCSAAASITAKPVKAKKEDNSKDSLVLLCPAAKVKTLKVYLESLQLLNKAFSITKLASSDSLESLRLTKVNDDLTVSSIEGSSADVIEFSAAVSQDIMALPVFPSLLDLLSAPESGVLCRVTDITQHSVALTALLLHSRTSKRTLANTFQQASDYLLDLARSNALPTSSLPAKYEVVGHFLMIPENALCGAEWDAWLAADAVRATTMWKALAGFFGLSKVARKAVIDSGLLRESRVQLLLPPVGTPAETGPGAVGWNTVVENKIAQSFDITRVMFCSGNITEKLRMANLKDAAGQTVVDFYCGIGYYTLPLLVHAKVGFVHALEWNPNSVLALRENLNNNKVDPSRYNILQGDNRVTSVGLVNVADRILLGLLPSSTAGWPLAARALKPSGGVIHVHENVVDSDLAAWVDKTVIEFERLLGEAGKPLKVEKIHLEKVKSYAPHIYHVVLDLKCYC